MKEPTNKYDFIDGIDLKKIFFKILFNWKTIFITTFLFISLWIVYFINAPRIYDVRSLIQIERTSPFSRESFDEVFSSGENILLEEQIEIYRSFANLRKVVRKLNLNSSVIENDILIDSLETNKFLNHLYVDLPLDTYHKVFLFEIYDDHYNVLDEDGVAVFKNNLFNKNYSSSKISLSLKKIEKPSNFSIIYSNEVLYIQNLQRSLQLFPVSRGTFGSNNTLLRISYLSDKPYLAKKIIDTANKEFLANSVLKNKSEAEQSLAFLQSQLVQIKNRLQEKEALLNQIKSKNSSIDLEFEIKALIEKSSSIESAIKEINLEIIKSNKLYEKSNPILRALVAQKDALLSEQEKINSIIKNLPANQQAFIDLSRESQADQLIYEQLLQKELEFSLMKASTIGDVQILDDAIITNLVSPNGFSSFVIFIFIGLSSGLVIIFLRNTLFMKITSPEDADEILDSSKLLGMVNIINDDNNDLVSNSVSTIASNLILLSDDRKSNLNEAIVIELVSGAPGQGKSTMSELIAKSLSLRDKKTLLIDCDYRKGALNRRNAKKYVNDDALDFFANPDKINEFKLSDFYWVVPAPKSRKVNSLNIFESLSFKNFIDNNKKVFDFIIIDSPAFLVLPDALVLSQYADEIIPVIRHNESKVSNIKEVQFKLDTVGKNINYYIYNAFNPNKFLNYYGYYGYYGDYYNYYNEYKTYYDSGIEDDNN